MTDTAKLIATRLTHLAQPWPLPRGLCGYNGVDDYVSPLPELVDCELCKRQCNGVSIANNNKRPAMQLYEFTALIKRGFVVAANSEEEARKVVAAFHEGWERAGDYLGVMDVELSDVRPMQSADWKDEAHSLAKQEAT